MGGHYGPALKRRGAWKAREKRRKSDSPASLVYLAILVGPTRERGGAPCYCIGREGERERGREGKKESLPCCQPWQAAGRKRGGAGVLLH